jgi:hypothetical protein
VVGAAAVAAVGWCAGGEGGAADGGCRASAFGLVVLRVGGDDAEGFDGVEGGAGETFVGAAGVGAGGGGEVGLDV